MTPLSLVFSSDEETSCQLGQVLKELGFGVEYCPEIFSAVDRLTSRSFDVIACDWDEGLEASFLLKTARELKSGSGAFAIAVGGSGAASAARDVGANVVLSKPILPEEAKTALLASEEFLGHMENQFPKPGLAAEGEMAVNLAEVKSWPVSNHEKHSAPALPARRVQPSPSTCEVVPLADAAGCQDFSWLESELFGNPTDLALPLSELASRQSGRRKSRRKRNALLQRVAVGVAFVSVAYLFSQPLRGEAGFAAVAKVCGRALERTQGWLHKPVDVGARAPAVMAQEIVSDSTPAPASPIHIRVTPIPDLFKPHLATRVNKHADRVRTDTPQAQQQQPQQLLVAAELTIPDSLKAPIATVRDAAKAAPSLLASLEPVDLPENLSASLLLQGVPPSYPERAVRAGLQGPVVLQLLIARDGTIQDLKLIRGSLLLGQAAYQAVKQWRYRPFLRNGQAVEAMTFVTIDFKLP